jgi:predicted dehydrogenase
MEKLGFLRSSRHSDLFYFLSDVVYIGVANHKHHSTVIQALEAKKSVLCEKPMGISANEVREMIEVARRNKTFLMEV